MAKQSLFLFPPPTFRFLGFLFNRRFSNSRNNGSIFFFISLNFSGVIPVNLRKFFSFFKQVYCARGLIISRRKLFRTMRVPPSKIGSKPLLYHFVQSFKNKSPSLKLYFIFQNPIFQNHPSRVKSPRFKINFSKWKSSTRFQPVCRRA